MGNFLTLNFWFNLRPGVFIGFSLKIVLGFILWLIILAVVAGIGKKRWVKSLYAGLWNSLYYFFLTNAIIGLVLTFFNYEMVPFLSARFWFLLWGISLAVWLFFIYRTIIRIPQKKARLEKEKEFNKYIP
ncbi:MAG: hypothetical protein UU95_C0008G0026 [Parcubacteria group bacterium GW2011_GWC2_42_12]|uniref:Uncharacterized protein n=2 Tax=Candidatus Falkowiibacteriota TaxID=1752728 RepID=A0A1F5S952_9BACT|nr:MAG: hypothetical protein UU43_C0001G0085 [Candidatus Falkowbacteria bacterium GW2011_GWA2_41_14]KKS34818.1 MAG: hypothetical protein UU95_C0008G0026 [Parcubacteria group bacterium GW2011_GWC2_42_12]OGF23244.1 MAG: hypothetical protein A3D45_03050 [Candidatus Falkowbacteria bacterium RIFCSPHIGHO2_02_FULL_42_9]